MDRLVGWLEYGCGKAVWVMVRNVSGWLVGKSVGVWCCVRYHYVLNVREWFAATIVGVGLLRHAWREKATTEMDSPIKYAAAGIVRARARRQIPGI